MLTLSALSVKIWDTLPQGSYQAWEDGSSNSWEARQWEAPHEQGREGSIKGKVLLMPGKGTHGTFMSPR
jgi:hypothetical protein